MQIKSALYWLAFLATISAGCLHSRPRNIHPPLPGPTVMLDNPLVVAGDTDFVWNQIVDTLDDYFRIQREQRVQNPGVAATEGLIETFPPSS